MNVREGLGGREIRVRRDGARWPGGDIVVQGRKSKNK